MPQRAQNIMEADLPPATSPPVAHVPLNSAAPVEMLVLMVAEQEATATAWADGLRAGGLRPTYQRVYTPAEMRLALTQKRWEIILTTESAAPLRVMAQAYDATVPIVVVSDLATPPDILFTHTADTFPVVAPTDLAVMVYTLSRSREAVVWSADTSYRDLVEQASHGIYRSTPAGQFLTANLALARMLGYASVDELLMHLLHIEQQLYVHPARRDEFRALLARYGEVNNFEAEVYRRDGHIIWVALSARVVYDRAGEELFYEGLAEDITARKHTEAALRESEARYRLLFNEMLNGFVLHAGVPDALGWMTDYRFVDVNPAFERMLNQPASQLIGQTLQQVLPQAFASWAAAYQQVVLTGQAAHFTFTFPATATATGQTCELIAYSPQAGHYATLLVDLTARREAETAGRRYQLLAENARDLMIFMRRADGRILEANAAAVAAYGYPREELLTHHIDDLEAEHRPEVLAARMEQACAGGVLFEATHHDRTGRTFPVEVSWVGMATAEAASTETVVLSIARDITDRKQRERELEAVSLISGALRSARARADMVPSILDQLIELLRADGASLELLDATTNERVVELGRGTGLHYTGRRVPRLAGAGGHVLATGQPYVTQDARNDPLFSWPHFLGTTHVVAGMPLMAQGNPIGVIWVGRHTPIRDDELRLLMVVTNIAANALHRATLAEQTEQRLQRLGALRSIERAISSNINLRSTLNVFLNEVLIHLRVDAASVLLYNPQTNMLEYAAGRGFRTVAIERSRLALGEGYAGRAAAEHRSLSIPNLAEARDFLRRTLLIGEGFVAYKAVPLITKGKVRGVLDIFHRAPLAPDPEWQDFLETMASQAAVAIDNAALFEDLQHKNVELTLAYDATIEGWSRALDLRDKETEGHTQRVTEMTVRLARAMGFKDDKLVHIYRGALLHDIGKMGVPDSILLKPAALTDAEWVIMRMHPEYAYSMLAPIAYLRPALDIPYCHHERWDGKGYPRQLQGEHIPFAARIFAIADVWDALRSDRPYRKGWPEAKVRDHIRDQAGTHFDAKVVEVFLSLTTDDF